MSSYRTDAMTLEEERDFLCDLLQRRSQETEQLERLLALTEARLASSRGFKATPLSGVSKPEGVDAILANWRFFWKDNFNLDLDFTTLRIPERQEGFNRLLVMPAGMTANRLYEKCAKLFLCWKYADNLDSITSDRGFDKFTASNPAKMGTYAIWVRDRVEADEELKGKSAEDLAQLGVKGITLSERLLHELKYFLETDKHLDVKNITLCSGSRDPDGFVPSVRWHSGSGGMLVGGYDLDRRGEVLRARAAVTL